MTEYLCIVPLALLVLGGLALMVADAFSTKPGDIGEASALLLLLTACFDSLLLAMDVSVDTAFLQPYLTADPMALVADVVVCVSGALAILMASKHLRDAGIERGEFYILMVFTTFGALVLARATSTVTLFLGLETLSLGVYSLVAFRRTSRAAAEAAIKYFLLGSFAAAILLFGSALLYASTGHLDFAGIGAALPTGGLDTRLTVFGLALVLVGLAFKVSAVPFHAWAPDAYEGAPIPTTAYMSVVVKVAAFFLFARMFIVCFGDPVSSNASTGWPLVMAVLALLSMLIGNVAALWQRNLKRLFAYSSIGHAGYLLIGLAVAHGESSTGTSAMVFYLIAYAASSLAVFASIVLLSSRKKEIRTIDDLRGLGRTHPLATLPLLLGTFSLMGMPPTAGFFGKYYVFLAAIERGAPLHYLAPIGIVTSAIGLLYYLKVIGALYMRTAPSGAEQTRLRFSPQLAFAMAVTVYFILKIGLTPARYLELAQQAAQQIS